MSVEGRMGTGIASSTKVQSKKKAGDAWLCICPQMGTLTEVCVPMHTQPRNGATSKPPSPRCTEPAFPLAVPDHDPDQRRRKALARLQAFTLSFCHITPTSDDRESQNHRITES